MKFSAKVMKQLITERENLTLQWKEAMKMMHQRDNDVINVQNQILAHLEITQQQEEKLAEENTFFNNEQRNNAELEIEIQNLNLTNSTSRKDFNDLTHHVLFLKSEVIIFANNLLFNIEITIFSVASS